jgi:hypothetical protein
MARVQALLYAGEYDMAYSAGSSLPIGEGDSDELRGWYSDYVASLSMKPRITDIDLAGFPLVAVTVSYSGGMVFDGSALGVPENGAGADLVSAEVAGAGTAGAGTAGAGAAGAGTAGAGTAAIGATGAGMAGAGTAGTGTAGADTAGVATSGAATAGAGTAAIGAAGADAALADAVAGEARLSFIAQDAPNGPESRAITVTIASGGLVIPVRGNYLTPSLADAALTLVTTDISGYPSVRAFFRVEDPGTGEHVRNIPESAFAIRESVAGGEYLAREVKSAKPLLEAGEGRMGANIDLVADKSDSISPSDMAKIKQVMAEFADVLQYGQGDKAEVLAFDTIVQQMCTYTGDRALIKNGIGNMSTDGATAFFDAVISGIHNAALQGGARCVIAFTDGMDNRSLQTAEDAISYANSKQVPLFIVGVGAVDEYTLRQMAERTNGRYWYIDDLYDLREIYETVYSELKELYVVEYDSDPSADAYAVRSLDVKMSGGGYKGDCAAQFTPSRTAPDRQGGGSRYEIFMEDVSWEAANRRCLEMGGHLATITSQAENDEIVKLAETTSATYVWLGGYTSYDDYGNVFAHWITGENFGYSAWMADEPSRVDKDGTPEWYLMLWHP